MDVYINSAGVISAAGNNIGEGALGEHDYNTIALPSADADYKAFIPVMQLRRMSKAVRMGVVASKVVMQNTGIEKPDAICVGTAYGCLQDTERFMDKMVEQDEQMLTPTAFIQSTHNTVSGQIALLAKCNGHNLTFVHKGHSFEHALIDAGLYLDTHADANILVGGIDELTEHSTTALQIGGVATQAALTTKDVTSSSNKGTVIGEGAAFFSVTQKPLGDKYVHVKALNIFKATTTEQAIAKTKNIIAEATYDAVLIGSNGDATNDVYYKELNSILGDAPTAMFKHLCGEYPTSSSFALGVLTEYVRTGKLIVQFSKQPEQLKNVLLINNFCDHYSIYELGLSV